MAAAASLRAQGSSDAAIECLRRGVHLRPSWPAAHNNLASALSSVGDAAAAERAYQSAISLALAQRGKARDEDGYAVDTRQNGAALSAARINLSGMLQGRGQYGEALRLVQAAAEDEEPPSATTWNAVAIGAYYTREPHIAEHAARKALALQPGMYEATYNLANALRSLQRHDEAVRVINEALAAHKKDGERMVALLGLAATIAHEQGRSEEAVQMYLDALRIAPSYADAHSNLGNLLGELGRTDEGIKHHLEAVRLGPRDARYFNNLGLAYRKASRLEDAVATYRRAVDINPNMPEPWFNLANTLKENRQLNEAVEAYNTCIRLDPTNSNYVLGLANVRYDRGDYDDAESFYLKAIAADSTNPDSWYNLGNVRKELGKLEEAVEAYQRCLSLIDSPPPTAVVSEFRRKRKDLAPSAFFDMVYAKTYMCEWKDRDADMDRLRALLADGADLHPFQSTLYPLSGAELLALSKVRAAHDARFVLNTFAGRPLPVVDAPAASAGRLRVAFMSPDFLVHPVANDIVTFLRALDRTRFEVVCIALTPDDGSTQRKLIREAADVFVEFGEEETNEALAARLNGMQVNIVIDLAGFTKKNRLPVLAARPAPLQVLWKGYAGTTGATFIDYVVGDRIATPVVVHDNHFAEKLVVMPNQFFVNDLANSHASLVRRDAHVLAKHGMPGDETFLFCNFNKLFKVDPRVWGVWMKILLRVPSARLWLQRFPGVAESHLLQAAQAAGVSADRLLFTDLVPADEHLQLKSRCDLFLDTFEYNAHGTMAEALWAGVPVLTMPGHRMTARVATSINHAAGLTDFIAENENEYLERAVSLATKLRPTLGDLQVGRLAMAHLAATPAFNATQFASDFGAGLEQMWEVHVQTGSERWAIVV